MFCERRMIKDSIVPAGIPTIVPILTYGAIKKSPIQIPPSFVRHRVAPVTRGNRKSLVMWFGGTPFR